MVAPLIIGAGIGALSALGGAAISKRANKKAAQKEYEHQKEFAQHGIRWKVEDAKAAGLHPLYALGSQPTQYIPAIIPDSMGPGLAEAGQNISRALQAQQTTAERQAHQLALQKLQSEIAESDARRGLIEAEAFKLRQEAVQSAPFPFPEWSMRQPIIDGQEQSVPAIVPEAKVKSHPLQGQVKVVPSEVPTSSSTTGYQAGSLDFFREATLPNGMKIAIPASQSVSEALESMSESALLMNMVLLESERRYGKGWISKFNEDYGMKPWWNKLKPDPDNWDWVKEMRRKDAAWRRSQGLPVHRKGY